MLEFDGEGRNRKDRIGLGRLAAILATMLGVSIGLCGANIVAVTSFTASGSKWREWIADALITMGWLEIIAKGVSSGGLLILGLIALTRTITRRNSA